MKQDFQLISSILNEQFEKKRTPFYYRAGQVGKCICPKCKTMSYKIKGVPCKSTKCLKCGSFMVRKLLTW